MNNKINIYISQQQQLFDFDVTHSIVISAATDAFILYKRKQ